jgi:hypothetical protein
MHSKQGLVTLFRPISDNDTSEQPPGTARMMEKRFTVTLHIDDSRTLSLGTGLHHPS